MKIPATKIVIPKEDHSDIFASLENSFTTGVLTNGPVCRNFEKQFKELVNRKYAISTNSGTSALEVAFRIIGVKGKEVLVPTNTNFATAAAALYAGGTVKFLDCDRDTLSPSLKHIKEMVTDETKVLVLVHIGGIITPEIEEISRFCKESKISLLEDAAHAHGSKYKNKPAGSFGDLACFSFFPTKVITSGEGGIIVTDQEEVYLEAQKYIDQGKETGNRNYHTRMGNSWRMSELHAALGISQFNRLNEFIENRKKIAEIYDEGLKEIENSNIRAHAIPQDVDCNYYKYIVDISPETDRKVLTETLKQEGVTLSGGVYEIPCHLQPIFNDISVSSLQEAEYFCKNHICLPIYPTMTKDEAIYVLKKLRIQLRPYSSDDFYGLKK
ncbi:DegT/DnrJ/EryC1/StrS family aminotransferase [Alkaliphilus hydrothermalis]|uniref:dTDP-4-amino-4,6-dideoxygalactose transaminase n=1 Tax=Alkaliphilus hydrothermalis TaxID=1482730 RepID=A0ABS2NTH1_9FIRM|nr:DegT/DnrJ/EryC1/StrS family aminotransferase [Alkaliphilus hydrothermalis]MBM7616211.1 dTDP-4-amino-4,6-dideoxygalactose transaminase [Alkaliphilus hydrothermalis]